MLFPSWDISLTVTADDPSLAFTSVLTGTDTLVLSKNESGLIKSPVCLSVCPPLTTSEPLGIFS
jgi:hypothetical protein